MKFDYTKIPNIKINQVERIENSDELATITIITPFYNAGETFEDTFNSIISQTYPFFEWIIVDDGSKDKNSLDVLEKFSKLDSRIKVFHKENGGPSLARDFGIARASKQTKYVYFIDTDDMIEKTTLECLYMTLETHSDYSFASPTMTNFGDMEFMWNQYLTVEREKKENVIPIATMVKKEDLLEVGCFGIKEKAMYEDWNLWLKLLKAGKKPIRINEGLFWYRFSNSGELSRAKKNHANAMKYVDKTASEIKEDVEVLQFPKELEHGILSGIKNYDSMVLPQYKKDKRKTILFLVPWYKTGGADLFNLELIKRIDKKKYRVICASTTVDENDLKQQFKLYADEVYDMPAFLEVKDYLFFVDYLVKSRNVATIFLSNSTYGYAMLPYLKTRHQKLTVIDYIHSIDFKDKLGSFGKFTTDFADYIDMTYTCNQFTTNQIVDVFHKKKSTIDTLYIGTDHERFDVSKFDREAMETKYNIPHGKKVITFLARFSEEKRPYIFLKVAEKMKKNSDLCFVMVGDGPLLKEIRKKANKLNNVILLPLTNKAEEIYAFSDITVNCSRLEGLALTAYESLSMGVPVVASDVGGQKELINSKVGVIVPYSKEIPFETDVQNYVDAINKILNGLESYKKEGRKIIESKFNLNTCIKQFEDIIDSMKPSKVNKENDKGLTYELYINVLAREHNWLTKVYNQQHYGVNSKQCEVEHGIFAAVKRRIKPFLCRYNLVREYDYIEKFLRAFTQLLKGFCKSIIYVLPAIYYTIKFLLKLIYKKITGSNK